jgi:hypothetical protein
MAESEYVAFADRELECWPGVAVSRDSSHRHMRVTVTYAGRSAFVTCPTTGSDRRGPHNHVRDLRAVLRGLGAERVERVRP